jgi:hypothetical protein
MSNNVFVKLQRLLPPSPVLVGTVLDINEDEDYSTVELPTDQGTIAYAGSVAAGSRIRARGTFVPVGDKAFVRDGVIESRAPSATPIEIEVGVIALPPEPLAFEGPIDDQAAAVGSAFTLALADYWTGGSLPLAWSVVGGALPAGLTLNASTGVVSGTPTTEGLGSVTFRATDVLANRADSNVVGFDVEAPAAARWVAFRSDSSGRVMNSDDGVTWTDVGTTGAPTVWSVCYGNGKFVGIAHGATTRAVVSADGVNWSVNALTFGSVFDIAYGAGVYVASLEANSIRYSADGVSWTFVSLPGSGSGRAIAFGAGVFVRLRYSGGNTTRVLTSPDGITWTQRTTPNLNLAWISVVYSPTLGLFAAVASGEEGGSSANIMTSPDGITWTTRTNPLSSVGWGCVGVAPDGSFVALGYQHGFVLRSSNGITWSAAGGTVPTPPFGTAYRKIATYGSRMVAVSASGGYRVYSDDNGATWTSVATTGELWQCIVARPD